MSSTFSTIQLAFSTGTADMSVRKVCPNIILGTILYVVTLLRSSIAMQSKSSKNNSLRARLHNALA